VSPFSIAHQKPPVRFPPTTAVADGKHVAGHVANGAVMGPPVLPTAGNGDYRSPKAPGWAGYTGNVSGGSPCIKSPFPIGPSNAS
jgi:hypothetical protein